MKPDMQPGLPLWLRLFLRRRRYLVSARVQLPLILMSLIHCGFVVLLIAGILFGPLMLKLQSEEPGPAAVEIATQILYLHDRYWLIALLGLCVILLDAIRVSHRIAGPLYRMRRAAEQAARGESPGRIVLRRGDYLDREVETLNRLFEYSAELRQELTAALERIEARLDDSQEAVRAGDVRRVESALAQLADEKQKLQRTAASRDAALARPEA